MSYKYPAQPLKDPEENGLNINLNARCKGWSSIGSQLN